MTSPREYDRPGKKAQGAYWRPQAKQGENVRRTIAALDLIAQSQQKTCQECMRRLLVSAFVSWTDSDDVRGRGDRTTGSLRREHSTCNGCRGVVRDTQWWDRAACRGEDPELFFSAKRADIAQVRRLCAACPVAVACLRDAFRTEGPYRNYEPQLKYFGVRGGLKALERAFYHSKYKADGETEESALEIIIDALDASVMA